MIVKSLFHRSKWIQTPLLANPQRPAGEFQTFATRYNIDSQDAPYDVAVSWQCKLSERRGTMYGVLISSQDK